MAFTFSGAARRREGGGGGRQDEVMWAGREARKERKEIDTEGKGRFVGDKLGGN